MLIYIQPDDSLFQLSPLSPLLKLLHLTLPPRSHNSARRPRHQHQHDHHDLFQNSVSNGAG